MILKQLKLVSILLILFNSTSSFAFNEIEISRIKVVLRNIGHELLLISNDSTSRILPIKKESNKFKLEFESKISLRPQNIVKLIRLNFNDLAFINHYIIEVIECESLDVVYSYMVWDEDENKNITCASRELPKSCYYIYFNFQDIDQPLFTLLKDWSEIDGIIDEPINKINVSNPKSYISIVTIIVLVLIILWYFNFFKKKNKNQLFNEEFYNVGQYEFDKRNLTLNHPQHKNELTNKEADLLFVLFQSANAVLEREFILQKVWGDEGDYIGRTLDVFISKLRKKLSFDENLKIINVRGIGYKLIIN